MAFFFSNTTMEKEQARSRQMIMTAKANLIPLWKDVKCLFSQMMLVGSGA